MDLQDRRGEPGLRKGLEGQRHPAYEMMMSTLTWPLCAILFAVGWTYGVGELMAGAGGITVLLAVIHVAVRRETNEVEEQLDDFGTDLLLREIASAQDQYEAEKDVDSAEAPGRR